MFSSVLATAMAVSITSGTLSTKQDWQAVSGDQPIDMYYLDVEGTTYDAFRADGELCASNADLLDLVSNVDEFIDWLPRTRSVQRLEGDGFDQMIHIVSESPWPMRARDMTYHLTVKVDENYNSAVAKITGLPDHQPKQRNVVRMRRAEGVWELTFEADRAQVSFMMFLDVGRVPGFVASRSVRNAVRDTVLNLQSRFSCNA